MINLLNARVLFIYYDSSSSSTPNISFGVAHLSGYLKKHGCDTALCYVRSTEDREHVLQMITAKRPDVVAHSSTSSSFHSAVEVMRAIREAFPTLYQICGGHHISLCPDDFQFIPELDAVCIGYGEYPLLEFVHAVRTGGDYFSIQNLHVRREGKVIKNQLRPFPTDLDEFMPCDRELFVDELKRLENMAKQAADERLHVEEFIFCRGCPFQCTFCSNHILKTLGSGKYIQWPSVEKCITEIKDVVQRAAPAQISFHDDNFTLNKKWFRDFARQYTRHIGLPYGCNLRVNSFDEEDVRCLKESGCVSATVGIESGNAYIRNTVLGKGLARDDIVAGFRLLHAYGIKTCAQNMIGVPEETPERFLDTIRINAIFPPGQHMQALSVFYPYPGTVLYDKCISDDLLPDVGEPGNGFQERESSVLRLPKFPRDVIGFFKKNFDVLVWYQHLANRYALLGTLVPLTIGSMRSIALVMRYAMVIVRLKHHIAMTLRTRLSSGHRKERKKVSDHENIHRS